MSVESITQDHEQTMSPFKVRYLQRTRRAAWVLLAIIILSYSFWGSDASESKVLTASMAIVLFVWGWVAHLRLTNRFI